MLAIVLAAIVAAAPSPAPTPHLKVIVTVKSTTFCTAVRNMAVPIGYVTRRNEEAFGAIDHSLLKFLEGVRGVSAANVSDMQSLESELDDTDIYTPMSTLSVMQMQKISYEIFQNLTLEDQVMDRSLKQYPKGASPTVDALRQRMQNLMDLQRGLANQYEEFNSIYLDNMGRGKFTDDAASFKSLLRNTILGLSSALAAAHRESDPELLPQADAHDVAFSGSVAGIVKELRLQDLAFSNEIVTAGDTCGI